MPAIRLSILIPIHNVKHAIKAVLNSIVERFRAEQIDFELIVVDYGSRYSLHEQVQSFAREHTDVSLTLIQHPARLGEGAAIRAAISQAKGDFCLIQDANFTYDPRMLAPLLSGEADVVLGSRLMGGTLSALARLAVGIKISDVETSYMAFRTSLAQSIPLHSKWFGLGPELIIQFAKRHARFVEVPIAHDGRSRAFSSAVAILRAWLFSASHLDPAADMLVAMSRAKRFNQWMADTIAPCIAGDVIELGAGIGNLTVLLSPGCRSYLATDTDKEHLAELRSRTADHRNVKLGICEFSNSEDINALKQSADTIICLNVLEHVADDVSGLDNIYKCLKPGGTSVILVPQGPEAFGSLDEVLEHKRRYTEQGLRMKMAAAGFQVTHVISFNRATWPGWYVNSKLLRRRTLSRFQLCIFDLLVPLWRRIDSSLPWPPTSLIAIGVATDAASR